jgi:hypothetical protein
MSKTKKAVTHSLPTTCQFPFADGRHCRMPIANSHPFLCLFHADRERQLAERNRPHPADDSLAVELASLSGEIKTAHDLNRVLTRLWSLVAACRIDRRTAATLAYVAALILQTLPDVKGEIYQAHGYAEWERTILRAFPRRQSPPQLQSRSQSQPLPQSQPRAQSQPTAPTPPSSSDS